MDWSIGKGVYRKDAAEKVTGAAKYTDDLSDAQMLHVKLKVSAHAHAKLKKIDTSKAKKVTGVHAIILGEALPLTGAEIKDRPILAYERVRYFGEPIAAVVAEHPFIAKQAAELIEVTYEPLPVVNDPLQALEPETTLLHKDLAIYEKIADVYPELNTNIANHVKVRKGSMDQGWQGSDISIEGDFSLAPSDHSAMETRCAIVEIKPDGVVHITSTTQAPYGIKKELSDIFHLDEGKIIAKVPFVGGAFGGKVAIQLELIAYLASKAIGGKRVKLLFTREEDMITAPVRMGLNAKIKLGATTDGKLTAAKITYMIDTGAYADKGTLLTKAVAATGTGPYNIDHVSCDAICVYTNHPYTTAYRGFSHSEILFVFERAMDMLARKLDMDPLEFRKKNAILKGHTSPTQTLLNESSIGDLPGCIDKLKELMNWREGLIVPVNERKLRVKGMCCSWKTSTISGASSGVVLLFNTDGSVNILSGIVEIGMGTKTVLAQLLAERLKMDVNKVHVQMEVDTKTIPEHYKTVASRGTLLAGRALLKAADDAVEQLRDIASRVLTCSPEDLEVGYEKVYVRDDPCTFVHMKDVCYGYQYPNGHSIGGQVIGKGNYTIRHLTHLDNQTGKGKTGPEWTVGAQGVEVEFDPTDFTYKLLKAYSVIDIGKVLNYKTALGQVMGSMSMGLNHASAETLAFNQDGTIPIPKLRTYGTFRYGDHPEYVADFLETAHLDGPYGARGVGEHALIGMPAALANALSNATGLELNKLPLTPEYIWRKKAGIEQI
ncbi:xanthine dehydrogenase family protein molybdopterin-binding subunit [Lentibacillus sp. N15]|uniref:xanthine dehydrogenase family protein molybdopterin-binding subunit n=1 Tax=Lentibacillus songyuanensis TaxID=3136161 RepID=UPI0031B9C867